MRYPWWQLPWRACLMAGTLARSFWDDWFGRRP